MRRIALLMLCIWSSIALKAQWCGFNKQLNSKFSKAAIEKRIGNIEEKIADNRNFQRSDFENIEIPLVIHIVHLGEDEGNGSNISDQQVASAVQALNEAFAGKYGGSDSKIRFQLATRAPDCSYTAGIIRVNAAGFCQDDWCYSRDGISIANDHLIKSLSYWPSSNYLNIWVVNAIEGNNSYQGIQGYSTFPGFDVLEGVVILSNAFGHKGLYPQAILKQDTRFNRVFTHEIGHALGLYHTFEGDDINRDGFPDRCPSFSGCGIFQGDCVDDTPPHKREFTACSDGDINVCDGGFSKELYVHNFMNYAHEDCVNEFSRGQIKRMQEVVKSLREGWMHTNVEDQPVVTGNPAARICKPQTQNLDNNFGLGITEVQLNDESFYSSDAVTDGGYANNWCRTFTVSRQNEIFIKTSKLNVENVKVYLDINRNQKLSEQENVFSSGFNTEHSGSFELPNLPKNKVMVMRVISEYAGFTITGPCYEPVYGQVEDYTVVFGGNVANSQSPPPQSFEVLSIEKKITRKIKLFPNPTSDYVIIENSGNEVIKNMKINTLNGLEMLSISDREVESNKQLKIELNNNLPPGLYIFSGQLGENQFHKKFLITP